MALSFRTHLSLAQQRPSAACTAAVPTPRPARFVSIVVRAAAEPVLPVASRRAALAMGACGALLSAAPAWSKEQQVPADDLPAGSAGTVKPTLRPDFMQKIATSDTHSLVYVGGRGGNGGKGGSG